MTSPESDLHLYNPGLAGMGGVEPDGFDTAGSPVARGCTEILGGAALPAVFGETTASWPDSYDRPPSEEPFPYC